MGIFITILLGGLLIIGFISLKPKEKKKDSISLLTEKKNTSKKKVNKKFNLPINISLGKCIYKVIFNVI